MWNMFKESNHLSLFIQSFEVLTDRAGNVRICVHHAHLPGDRRARVALYL